MIKLSVIVVNYNVKYFLEQCLLSVRKAAAQVPVLLTAGGENDESGSTVEVFVVDNNSVDGSVEMVQGKFPEVKLIRNHENKGFSAANNQAIKQANGQFVLILNPDTVLEEDTFSKCLQFMEDTPDAGGIGVKMLDGKGDFLPESKRAFPSPAVALYKVMGLSALFPKSRLFGQYHLGYLNEDETHEVNVLSGAFMFLRKEVLDKVGAFDEDFFMYGEDIDLSYRIVKGGYKNYYYPASRIIHYKGESTKKGSLNYVRLFYMAMIIFAEKHLKGGSGRLLIMLIKLAVYGRAVLALLGRITRRGHLALLDAGIMYGAMYSLKDFWATNIKGAGDYYPSEYHLINIPGYIMIWLVSIYFSGAYDRPFKSGKLVRGIFLGTLLIAAFYGFLPEEYRFSRAMIVLGAGMAVFLLLGFRLLIHFFKHGNLLMEEVSIKRTVILGNFEESQRVRGLLDKSEVAVDYLGFLAPEDPKDELAKFLGVPDQLKELVDVYGVEQVIFCATDVSSQEIIDWMIKLGSKVDFKIVPEHSLSIIGSNSKNSAGDLYAVDIDLNLTSASGRRNKRVLDLLLCLGFFLITPIILLRVRDLAGFFENWFSVIWGSRTWVGLAGADNESEVLSEQKPGVLDLTDGLKNSQVNSSTLARLNLLYARDYSSISDLRIIWRGFRNLGRR